MSWTMLWARNKPGVDSSPDESDMRFGSYWNDRFKESVMKARVRCETILFALFLIGGLVLLYYPSLPIDRTTWLFGFCGFVVLFLIELCFVSPYQYAKSLTAEHRQKEVSLQGQVNALQKKVDWLMDMERKEREKLRGQVLGYTLEQLKGGQSRAAQEFLSFQAFYKAGAHGLPTNEDLVWVCDEVAKFHDHPFKGLDECVLPEERLAFVKWGKAHPTLSFDLKGEYVTGAEQWAQEHDRPNATVSTEIRYWPHILDQQD